MKVSEEVWRNSFSCYDIFNINIRINERSIDC